MVKISVMPSKGMVIRVAFMVVMKEARLRLLFWIDSVVVVLLLLLLLLLLLFKFDRFIEQVLLVA